MLTKITYRFLPALALLLTLSLPLTMVAQDDLPSTFLMGEYEKEVEKLNLYCGSVLLSVCDDSMDEAYTNWFSMLSDIEKFAEEKEFDIKGVKIWIQVYWNADGTIKHISYYPKPTSKNMDFTELTDFFNLFIKDYKFNITHDECFNLYSTASFPTFSELFNGKKE